jgi:hypothetical protein
LHKRVDKVAFVDDEIRFREVSNGENFQGIEFLWSIKPVDLNKTSVTIAVNFLEERIVEKLKIIIDQSDRTKASIEYIRNFNKELNKDLNEFQIDSIVSGKLEASRCICYKIDSFIDDKANQMNKNIDALASYIPKDKKSPPRIYIYEIDKISQQMKSDFCFPISNTNIESVTAPFFIKNFPSFEGYVYDFRGNYNKSHRGWFQLLKKVEMQNEKIVFPIVEIFHDSPFSSTDDKTWLSQTFFSLKTSYKNK